jgi:branched-chain amino acid transport system permease protein
VSLVVQVIVTGVAAGGVYGLIAVGHSLIYRLTGVIYFAFGDLVAFAVFATLLVAAGTAPISQTSLSPGRFLLGLAVGLLLCVGVGAATYVLFVEPYLLRGSTLGWVAATLAIAFALRGMVGAVFTRPAYVFPDPLPFDNIGRDGVVSLAGASVQIRSFFVIALAAVLAALAAWTLERTRHGRALQAISSDPEGARFTGLPVEALVALTFGLVGGLAALAAVVAAPSAPFSVDTGALLGLKGLVAALIVRFGSPWAAFAAGLGVGVAEAAIDSLRIGDLGLGPQYGEILPLALALGLIAVRSLRTEAVPGRA